MNGLQVDWVVVNHADGSVVRYDSGDDESGEMFLRTIASAMQAGHEITQRSLHPRVIVQQTFIPFENMRSITWQRTYEEPRDA